MLENLKFCYERNHQVAQKTKQSRVTQAVAIRGKYWDKGYSLKIHFLNGDGYQINLMKSVIEEILSPISLTASYVEDKYISDIRISFNYGYGSYSYLGTDARFIPKSEETLNIGWSGASVMRHEFGHALNLSHEHQNPNGGIVWDEQKVIQELSGPPNNWDEATIRYNVLDQYDLSKVDSTAFDPDSVMLYYFPNDWTIGDFKTNDNDLLSVTDKKFLLDIYGTEVDKIAPVITIHGDEQMIIEYGEPYFELGATAIDNKDGNISSSIQIIGTVETNVPGIHPILYSVHDRAGNHTEKVRNVLVKEEVLIDETDTTTDEPDIVIDEPTEPITPKKGCGLIVVSVILIIASSLMYFLF
jgi:hypothetical protein